MSGRPLNWRDGRRPAPSTKIITNRQPGLARVLAAKTKTPDAFLRAEAAGDRLRHPGSKKEQRDAGRKSRITLPKVKGYWE